MRSSDIQPLGMFSHVSVEDRVPGDHPIRKLRVLVDAILGELDERAVITDRSGSVANACPTPGNQP